MPDYACAHPLAARLQTFYSCTQDVEVSGLIPELIELVQCSELQTDSLQAAAAGVPALHDASGAAVHASQQLVGALCDALAHVPADSLPSVMGQKSSSGAPDSTRLKQHADTAASTLLIAAALASKLFLRLDLKQPEMDEFGGRQGRQQLYMTAQIEDVDNDVSELEQMLDASRAMLASIILACLQYITSPAPGDDAATAAANGASADEADAAADISASSTLRSKLATAHAPYSSDTANAAARAALQAAAAAVAIPQPLSSQLPHAAEPELADSTLSAQQLQLQDLLYAALPHLLPRLRAPLVLPAPRYKDELLHSPLPELRLRCSAAQQLLGLLVLLQQQHLAAAAPHLLPLALAAADDSSPAVRRMGFQALYLLASRADLSWQRQLLLDAAVRAVTGCDEQLWPAAFPAAAQLVMSLEEGDPRAAGYHMLLDAMLGEISRTPHVAIKSEAFLEALAMVVPYVGVHIVRHFARLMPLMVEWVHSSKAEARLQAIGVMMTLVRYAWPRLAVHADVLQSHLQRALQHVEATGASPEQRMRVVAGTEKLSEMLLNARECCC